MNYTIKYTVLLAIILSTLSYSVQAMNGVKSAIHARNYITKSVLNNKWYRSNFTPPNKTAEKVLIDGQILGKNEQPHQMVERVINTIASAEKFYGFEHKNMSSIAEFANQLGNLVDEHAIVFSTPILTNAGRFHQRPLSACVMPPVNLKEDFKKVTALVNKYHQDGMGTGYNLSDEKDPVGMLAALNKVAVDGARDNNEQRPVGNMAILNVYSPAIQDFIAAKLEIDSQAEQSKFNISIDVDDEFMHAVKHDTNYMLQDGNKIWAKNIFGQIAHAAHKCGDPGLISLKRLNNDNPTPLLGEYKSTAPCAEVGLAPGETCVFGYINLAKFITDSENPTVDLEKLGTTVKTLIRALDTILEISIDNYTIAQSKSIMTAKRKVGIGVCGFADMLIRLGYSYEQQESRDLLKNILSFISFYAKENSVELGKSRGSFTGIAQSKYMDESFIMDKYGKNSTGYIAKEQWLELAKKIKNTKHLRNASTTALPPTGRSAMVIAASTGIEPLFSLYTADGIYPALLKLLQEKSLDNVSSIIQEIQTTGRCPQSIQSSNNQFVTATEITPYNHLAMTIAACNVIDESISKTVNLPEDTTAQEVEKIYIDAYDAGLKGISIYRNGSRCAQPKSLT